MVGRPEAKGTLRRPRNILERYECGDTRWTVLAQDSYKQRALVNAVMNLRVP
jgi:hypothetical protein